MSDVLLYSVSDQIATISLNRPDSLNSFNVVLRRDLLRAIETASEDPAVRTIVIKGEGRAFCAGADLAEGLERRIDDELREEYKPILMAISESPKPCIAQVHGSAAGIGAALALVCDLVIMSEDAYMYLAFAAIGLVPDGGLNWLLFNALGPRRAFEIITEGKKIPASECLPLGMCNEVVPAEELDSAVLNRAAKLSSGAPLAQAAVKKLLRQMSELSYSQAINAEAELQQALAESEDCRNAVAAFFKKEKPVFKGK